MNFTGSWAVEIYINGPSNLTEMMPVIGMGLLPDTLNCGLRIRRECQESYPRPRRLEIPTCITARASRTCRDAMPGSLTCVFLWSWWRGKRSRHSRRMRNPQFYVSGKMPMESMVSRACLRYTRAFFTPGICNLIKLAAMETLMSLYRQNPQSCFDLWQSLDLWHNLYSLPLTSIILFLSNAIVPSLYVLQCCKIFTILTAIMNDFHQMRDCAVSPCSKGG